MRLYKSLLLLLLFSPLGVRAHMDYYKKKTFGKVVVNIKTGFEYEEISKVWVIGELVNQLAKKLNYNDSILLYFNHSYTEYCLPDHFVSFDNGSIIADEGRLYTIPFLTSNALVIRAVSRRFDAEAILKLTEYGIINLSSIKTQQRKIKYNKNYCQWLINSIDTAVTRKVAVGKSSGVVNEILKHKVYRAERESLGYASISWYFKNNAYNVYSKTIDATDTLLLTVGNIYQFERISRREAILFDTDSTFYYIQGINYPWASERYTIKNKRDFFEPYQLLGVGTYKVALSFQYYSGEEVRQPVDRTAIFRIDKKELIQDLDKDLDCCSGQKK